MIDARPYAVPPTAPAIGRARQASRLRGRSRRATVMIDALVALAGRTAITAVRQHRSPVVARGRAGLDTPGRAFLGLLGLTLLNPATIVHFGALVLGRQASTSLSPGAEAVFVVAAFVASASWQLLLAGGGSLVGRVLSGPRGRLATSLTSSIVIVILAVMTVT